MGKTDVSDFKNFDLPRTLVQKGKKSASINYPKTFQKQFTNLTEVHRLEKAYILALKRPLEYFILLLQLF